MAATRFRYNPNTCRYEPFYLKGKILRNRVLIFLSLSLIVALCGYFTLSNYYETVDEMLLERQHGELKAEWSVLHHRIEHANQSLGRLIDKDDNNYRIILDSNPLSKSIREAGVGGSERINHKLLRDFPVILDAYIRVEKLKHQVDVEVQSYKEIERMYSQKSRMWDARPAIQPLSNLELIYLHTRYGSRLHPILGYIREHKGLDFSADIGTPVYATGSGKVKNVYYSESLGNVIFLDHLYGYETRYAHLSRFNVTAGQEVQRGQLIGFVGSTGLSEGPHLHYEVLYQGEHVNPINFFQRDLNNVEYEKLIEQASRRANTID